MIEFMFKGINIFWAWLRVILTWAFRPGLKWLWVGTKTYLGSKTWTVVQTIITTLEGTEKIKTEKNNNNTIDTTTRMYSRLTGFIFPQWKYTFQWNWQEISKSCHVSFFSKIVKSMKGKSKLIYSLFVY